MPRPAVLANKLGWATQQKCREIPLGSILWKLICLAHSVSTSHLSSPLLQQQKMLLM